jgi:hypothetical protein
VKLPRAQLGLFLALGCAAATPALARVALRGADPKAELTIDGAPAGRIEDYDRSRLRLPAGHHVFTLRSPAGTLVREADVGPGDDIALDFNPAGGNR